LAGTCFGRRLLTLLAALCSPVFFALSWRLQVPANFDNNGEMVTVPLPEHYCVVFAGSVLFALGDSVWESQLLAILQSWYKSAPRHSDAAMANVKMWQSLGFACQFGIQSAGIDYSTNALLLLVACACGVLVLFYGDR
jgi:hypothetical protein